MHEVFFFDLRSGIKQHKIIGPSNMEDIEDGLEGNKGHFNRSARRFLTLRRSFIPWQQIGLDGYPRFRYSILVLSTRIVSPARNIQKSWTFSADLFKAYGCRSRYHIHLSPIRHAALFPDGHDQLETSNVLIHCRH